jgi:hypothetical protein
MKLKSNFYEIFLQFQNFMKNQFSCKIKKFRSDSGAEFF